MNGYVFVSSDLRYHSVIVDTSRGNNTGVRRLYHGRNIRDLHFVVGCVDLVLHSETVRNKRQQGCMPALYVQSFTAPLDTIGHLYTSAYYFNMNF